MDKKEQNLIVDLLAQSGMGKATGFILLHMHGLGEIPSHDEFSRRN